MLELWHREFVDQEPEAEPPSTMPAHSQAIMLGKT
jgi:hypothetical protein